MQISIVLKYNPQYLPNASVLAVEPSASNWVQAVRKAINDDTAAYITATVADFGLHELWTYMSYQMDTITADQIFDAVNAVTERDDWRVNARITERNS